MSKLLIRLAAAYAVNGIPSRVQHLAGLLQLGILLLFLSQGRLNLAFQTVNIGLRSLQTALRAFQIALQGNNFAVVAVLLMLSGTVNRLDGQQTVFRLTGIRGGGG